MGPLPSSALHHVFLPRQTERGSPAFRRGRTCLFRREEGKNTPPRLPAIIVRQLRWNQSTGLCSSHFYSPRFTIFFVDEHFSSKHQSLGRSLRGIERDLNRRDPRVYRDVYESFPFLSSYLKIRTRGEGYLDPKIRSSSRISSLEGRPSVTFTAR